jgi:predicted amidohydrolase
MVPAEMKLTIAACQFPVSGEILRNLGYVKRQMQTAAERGADVALFPECALGGYAGWDFPSFDGYDWETLRVATEEVIALAGRLGLWVVLGSNHRLTGRHRPHNSLYLIDPTKGVVDRYDKLFCMGTPGTGDLAHYTPGSRIVTRKIEGIDCGFLICHDWRYPELYRELERRGVRVVLQSWYDGNIPDRDWSRRGDVNREVLPATIMGHAACNHLWIAGANTSQRQSVMGGLLVRPDGTVAAKGPRNRAHVLVATVDTSLDFPDLSRPWRRRAAKGVLHSGRTVEDPRSRDRTRT